ncbi:MULTISPECIES: immunity protein TriTu family protein [Acinetobacter]|uniref:Uncharacterized protein n=1 Tax=Acinetobacter baylyi (strain ATCC 33305 / BD413 / ADP1) TaxID=62977 RepID=Q6F8S3_ACIAD|nr:MULTISPECIES: hypothetical protein [Acinetobacter]ENV53461.1 hypothetical protein F952_02522 [Acinetobacter baylyi DSM 14961 = CIP 107474]KAF2370806.1 hypothetical protein BSL88_09345 [Acinetobacter baylyi]KAF2375057.1 hypothetical protein BSL67_01795 [Acinetobacter baylyi]KAF2378402.1 hypothetical protein BSN81_03075 [Acinetobacter baylyi]KAF2380105.1 hypothetical protein BSN83_12510 [Acinetobacter baylyi]|tara:strand:+ start:379 stop:678 length:300 start_codon:yes stop_codon:yes gene_type:complete
MEILDQFNLWVRNISCIATKYGFFVEVEIQESYFTKIILDSDLCISEITLWGNNNLFVAEILDMRSSTTIYIDSGKYDSSINFSTFFNKFLQILELDVD